MATKKALWIFLGLAGTVLLAGVFFVGVIVFTVVRNLDIHPASPAAAEEEYYRLMDRFAGQAPLLEFGRDNPGDVTVHRTSERATAGEIVALRIFAWNPRNKKVVHLALPLWLLKLQPESRSARWTWDGEEIDLKKASLSVEDIESHGPGLILKYESRQGVRVVIWAE